MALTINWTTQVISIPQADLTPMGGARFSLDLNDLHLWLKDIEDDEVGMSFDDTHRHVAPIVVAGITISRVVEIINGYTIEFEDGSYQVILSGGNHNVSDVLVQNNVSLITNLSAGLVETGTSGLTSEESAILTSADTHLSQLRKLMRNRMETNPDTGVMTIFDDDDVTPLFSGNIYEDVTASQIYRGRGIERRDRLA